MHLAALAALTLLLLAQRGPASDMARAERLFASERWDAAAEAYERIAANDPARSRAWFRLGYVYLRLGAYSAARSAYERAAEFDDVREAALYNLARLDALLESGAIVPAR
ncbi:MAG: tetratricopeptide repeat protein [Planctomycetota bacterium]